MKPIFLLLFFSTWIPAVCWTQDFPDGWEGIYSGKMILGNLNAPNDTVPVTFELLELEKDSVWTYKMTYNSTRYGTIVKDYRIVAKEKGNTRDYLFDEQNGIIMEMTYMNGSLYGMYEVMDMIFVSTMRQNQHGLMVELFAGSVQNPMITEAIEEGKEPIEAKSYRPTLHQTVQLSKK